MPNSLLAPLCPSTPKYARIAKQLRDAIARDGLVPGDKLARVADLCREYQISLGTANKVLTALEQEGLITRTQGSGVYVACPARKRRQGAIGFYGITAPLSHAQHPYWAQLAQGALGAAKRNGLEIVLLSSELENVRWDKLDGVLVVGVQATTLKRHAPATLPVVTLMEHQAGLSGVDANDHQGARLLTEHLIELGHRRIAFLHSSTGPSLQARLDGYRDALRATGLKTHPHWERPLIYPLPEGRFFLAGRQGMNEWLQDGWEKLGCRALLCQNDETALGALEALRQAKVRVPQDISVAGFDGTTLAEYSHPRLTTINVPLGEIGGVGVEMLLRRMNGEAVSTRVLPVTLQIGDSTAPPQT